MKKIIYYITDHGSGHATRSIAIIRKLVDIGVEVIVRNSNSVNLLKSSLPESPIVSGKTDQGTVTLPNGISIDEKKSKEKIIQWIVELENFVNMECQIISKFQPNLIVSDISIMPLLVAKKKQIPSIVISNFSWYDVLKFLPDEDLTKIKSAYDYADLAIQLPIGTLMEHFKNKKRTGLVSRIPTKTREELRTTFGVKEHEQVITFAIRDSNREIKCTIDKNIKVFSMNTNINKSLNYLDLSKWPEGQEVILASDLVICKCGYGLISECLTNGISFRHIFDHNHLEQLAMSNELSKKGLNNEITLEELINFHISTDFIKSQKKIDKETNDINTVVNYITEFLTL